MLGMLVKNIVFVWLRCTKLLQRKIVKLKQPSFSLYRYLRFDNPMYKMKRTKYSIENII